MCEDKLHIFYIVYATTAANPKENSFACYYDAELETYLGDVYSVKWMEDVDKVLFYICIHECSMSQYSLALMRH